IAAFRAAAALEPQSAEAQHRLASFCWDAVQKDSAAEPSTRLSYLRDGIAAEDRALELRPDFAQARTSRKGLVQMLAALATDPAERARLAAEADPVPPFQGFGEPFEQTYARIQPIRVGGDVRQPTKVRDVKPVYPGGALANGVQGVVILEALIDE